MRNPLKVKKGIMQEMAGKKWAWLEQYMIPQPDGVSPYLLRTRIVATPLFGIYLHRMFSPDLDRDMHDHPWNFASFILRGNYMEQLGHRCNCGKDRHLIYQPCPEYQSRRKFSIHLMPLRKVHIIKSIAPGTVTLVFVGRRRQAWGFYPENTWGIRSYVPYENYDRSGF